MNPEAIILSREYWEKLAKRSKGAEYQSIVLLGAGWRERRDEYMSKIL